MLFCFCSTSGCNYLVVNCGGGTVDVTIHQVCRTVNRLPISKLHKPSAGVCGSLSNIDKNKMYFIYFRYSSLI